MLNIYNADGHLDRGRVLDELNERMRQARAVAKVVGPGSAFDALYPVLVNLLDECSEGYTHDPLTAPTMVTEYINACKPVSNHQRRA
jgi:polysaccharide deacetylase 2 family uncharacterized protein YibQ